MHVAAHVFCFGLHNQRSACVDLFEARSVELSQAPDSLGLAKNSRLSGCFSFSFFKFSSNNKVCVRFTPPFDKANGKPVM